MPIETLIQTFVIPGAVLFVWCLALWTPWSAKRWGGKGEEPRTPKHHGLRLTLTALGAGAAFAFSHRVIDGRWPDVPPTLTTNINAWFFWFALIAATASAIDALLVRKPWVRLAARLAWCAAIGAIPVLLLMQGKGSTYSGDFAVASNSGPMWIVIGTLAALLSWAAFTPRKGDAERLRLIVPLGVYAGILAPTMVMWSVAINAQFLGAASLVLASVGVITLWRPSARAYDAVAGYAVLMCVVIIASTYHFAAEYPPASSAILATIAPAFLFLAHVKPLRATGRIKRTLITTTLVAVPALAGLGVGVWEYFNLGEGPGALNEETSQEELWYGD